ncbi:MAG: hypothetical protein WCD89_07580 [Anaerocolumna sp.]
MIKAIFAAIVTIVVGILIESIGVRANVNIGSIFSIAIMGAFIIYNIDKKKDR